MNWFWLDAYILGWLISSLVITRHDIDENERWWWSTGNYATAALGDIGMSLFWPLLLIGWILGTVIRKVFGNY